MKVRLSDAELEAIRKTVKEVFGERARVWLFGSRVRKELKGGDIDLFIEVPEGEKSPEKKVKFLVKLKEKIGEQKIDLIVREEGENDFLSSEAKRTGVEL